jgi:hypothetical protein
MAGYGSVVEREAVTDAVAGWITSTLVRALVEVGCPDDLASELVGRHLVIERDPGPDMELRVHVLSVSSAWMSPPAPQDVLEAASLLAAGLLDLNRHRLALGAVGEQVEILWPLHRADSGERCPESGLWAAPDVGAGPRAFELGSILPLYNDQAVTWHLLV